ncbi:hypothetical protein C8Q74DRAFT_1458431 [Fomes fomentarius]|nr:hypothetical protein C8Q74DRAFT_1458431 [Fomes fomentarius]
MASRRNAQPGPSQGHRHAVSRPSSRSPAESVPDPLRPNHARKTVDSNVSRSTNNELLGQSSAGRQEQFRDVGRQNYSTLISKRAGGVPRAADRPFVRGEEVHPRKLLRKSASVPTAPAQCPQSSFTLVAPLLRTRNLPVKAGPLVPSFMEVEELREIEARKEQEEFALGPTRTAPRMSLPSMSVQRRAMQSPKKRAINAQSPSFRRISAHLPPGGAIQIAQVHVGRGGKLVVGRSDSEDSASESSEDELSDRGMVIATGRKGGQRAFKAARKIAPPDARIRQISKAARKLKISGSSDSDDGDDDDDDEDVSPRLVQTTKKARKRQDIPGSPEDVISLLDSSDEDIDELRVAFNALTFTQFRQRQYRKLPFLLRNLKKGFQARCRQAGVRIHPRNDPRGTVKVVYRYSLDRGSHSDSSSDGGGAYQTFMGSMSDWRCPLCELHKPFNRREMLVFHLDRDHAEVKTKWTHTLQRVPQSNGVTEEQEWHWKINLVIPDIVEVEEDSPEESSREPSDKARDLPQSDSDESSLPATPPPLLVNEEHEETKPIRQSASPTPSIIVKQLHSPGPRAGRLGLTTATRISYRGSLPARYPSPPPPFDSLGPAAQPPYLPETGPDGQPLYSCRIGGPRLFDLLNTLPMEEFGIMSWAIIDREELLFEMEDVRDEDKVMLALWNRYIMVHRIDFIFNDYFEGVKKFIDQYWEMIHLAAGWRALRAFLIMLCVNKYLTFDKVLKTLEYYENKTGMKGWYKENPEVG